MQEIIIEKNSNPSLYEQIEFVTRARFKLNSKNKKQPIYKKYGRNLTGVSVKQTKEFFLL